jgi:hypothetical protein
MKRKIPKTGWIETDMDYFWAHRQNGRDTGMTIAKISPKVFHVRYYPPNRNKDFDIGSRSTLTRAERLAESRLRVGLHGVL